MKTPRILLALIALLCAVAATFTIVAPSNAAAGRAAQLPARPKVGQCRNLTTAQGDPMTNNSPTVPCTGPHTTYTFAVPNLPKKVNAKHLSAKALETAGIGMCTPGYRKLLGGTWGAEDETMFSYTFFAPTKAQRAAGARWIRCDLILTNADQIVALPSVHRPVLAGAVSDAFRRCYTQQGTYVPCADEHAARAMTYVNVKATKYLTAKKFVQLGEKVCPKSDRAFFNWPNKYNWALGDRALLCYRSTAS
jgi:hypothetical protein